MVIKEIEERVHELLALRQPDIEIVWDILDTGAIGRFTNVNGVRLFTPEEKAQETPVILTGFYIRSPKASGFLILGEISSASQEAWNAFLSTLKGNHHAQAVSS